MLMTRRHSTKACHGKGRARLHLLKGHGTLMCLSCPPPALSGKGGPWTGAAPTHLLFQVFRGKTHSQKRNTGKKRPQPKHGGSVSRCVCIHVWGSSVEKGSFPERPIAFYLKWKRNLVLEGGGSWNLKQKSKNQQYSVSTIQEKERY